MVKLENVIPFRAEGHRIEFLQTRNFIRTAHGILTEDELSGLLNYISAYPDAGAVIQGTGGLRKLRWAAKGKGKRGGARVVYYFRDLNIPLILLHVFSKGRTSNLSKAQYAILATKVGTIVEALTDNVAMLSGDVA